MRITGYGILFSVMTIPGGAYAYQTPLPPPPEQPPEWAEHVPLRTNLHVETFSCDGNHGPEVADGPLEWAWKETGLLTLTGVVMHNGVENVDSKDIRAWQAGDQIVITYLVKSADEFPDAPSVACPGFTHLDIRIDGLKSRPRKVVIFPSEIRFHPAQTIPARASGR